MSFYYIGSNPYKHESSFFSRFFSYLFSSSVSSVSNSVGKMVLPAQSRKLENLDLAMRINLIKDKINVDTRWNVELNEGTVETFDGAKLDTIELSPIKLRNELPENKYYIIKFNGNCALYETQINNYAEEANKLKATVIGFNYRGVSKSQGIPKTKEKLVIDGITQVQRLLEEGADPKKITLDGLSLGGAVATLVAKHFYDQKIGLNLFNDRSFSKVSKVPAFALASEGVTETSFESTSSSILKATDWEMDAATAYRALPDENKGYMYVAKKSPKYPDNIGDGVIDPRASLNGAFKQNKKGQGIYHYKLLANTGKSGHNAPRNKLISKDNPNLTGQDIFENFVNRNRFAK